MGHNSVVSGHLKSIGILWVHWLSRGPLDLGLHDRYGVAHNLSVDHGADATHAMETWCPEASAMAQIDNQCQMVAHCIIEDTQSEVEGCEDHPPSEEMGQPRSPNLGTHPPPADLQVVLL